MNARHFRTCRRSGSLTIIAYPHASRARGRCRRRAMDETHARRNASSTQRRAAELFALIAEATGFLAPTAWPIADLLLRLWIGKTAIVWVLLLAHGWDTRLTRPRTE